MTTNHSQEYIESLNEMINDSYDAKTAVIAMSLTNYRPTPPDKHADVLMTSYEIANGLEDIATVTVNDVASVMVRLGYTVRATERGIQWAMDNVATQ